MKNVVYVEQSNKKCRLFFAIMMLLHGLHGVLYAFVTYENQVINFIRFGLILLVSLVLIVLCVSSNKNLMATTSIVLISPALLNNIYYLIDYMQSEYNYVPFIIVSVVGLFLSIISIILIIVFSKNQISILKVLTNTFLVINFGLSGFLLVFRGGFFTFGEIVYWIEKVISALTLLGPIWIVSVTYKKVNKITEEGLIKENQVAQQSNVSKSSIITENNDSVKVVKEYKKLLDSGIITQEEFDMKKKELLKL